MPSFEMVDGPDGRPVLTEVRVIGISNVPLAAEIDQTLPYTARWLQAAGWDPWASRGDRLAPRTGGEGGSASDGARQRPSGVNGKEAPEDPPPAALDYCALCGGRNGDHWKGCDDDA